jgi:hypothetical protein
MSSHGLIGCKRNLQRIEDRRRNSKHKQHGPIEAGEMIAILSMNLLEVVFPQEKWSIKVEPRQSQFPEAVPFRDSRVLDVVEVRGESAERRPIDVLRNEAKVVLLSNVEIGFMSDQVAVRPQKASCSGAKFGSIIVGLRLAIQVSFPEDV